MSIALMTLAWKAVSSPGQKLVLLALCDNANDQGECYPSISMLAQKCSMVERSVQKHIADLEAAGAVTRLYRSGRSTVYHVNPRRICTPAEGASPQNSRPATAETAPQGPQNLHSTPAESAPPQNLHPTPANSAPRTINEPSIEPCKPKNKHVASAVPAFDPLASLVEEGVSEQIAVDWLAVRKAARAPLTPTALDQTKREADKAGMTLEDALTVCCARNWRGFIADWVLQAARPAQAAPGYQSANDKAKNFADRLTGRGKNDSSDNIIDITPRHVRADS